LALVRLITGTIPALIEAAGIAVIGRTLKNGRKRAAKLAVNARKICGRLRRIVAKPFGNGIRQSVRLGEKSKKREPNGSANGKKLTVRHRANGIRGVAKIDEPVPGGTSLVSDDRCERRSDGGQMFTLSGYEAR
jgi:hypothetical protein